MHLPKEPLLPRVIDLVQSYTDYPVTPQSSLLNDLQITMDVQFELWLDCEEKFGLTSIDLPRRERDAYAKIDTVSDLVTLLEKVLTMTAETTTVPSVVTSIIIARGAHGPIVLLGKPPEGNWCLSGGLLKVGEVSKLAAARYAKEDFGIDLKPTDARLLTYVDGDYGKLGWSGGPLYGFYIGQADPDLKLTPPEGTEAQWFSLYHLPEDTVYLGHIDHYEATIRHWISQMTLTGVMA